MVHTPCALAHHTNVVYKDNLYLFGGNNPRSLNAQEEGTTELHCEKLFYLSLRTFTWSIVRTRGDHVILRDEHSSVYDPETTQMVIFGGFKQGNRTNEVATYNFSTNSWTNVLVPTGDALPCPRSGHSATLHNGNMYVFGGKNDESEKLDDLWVYNIADSKWTKLSPDGECPYPRSGHSCDVYDDWLVLFGGIWDVTKELNDLWFYSISKNVWVKVIDTANSPQIKSPTKN